jgi:mono/diheme cytochrome c family protein
MRFAAIVAFALACASTNASAQDNEAVKHGSQVYARHCATCHGPRLADPPWAIDLREFPKSERARFVDSVTYGKNNMPPWGDVLKPDDIAALWAYVLTGGEGK